ncbi:phage protease [Spartinivicinus ruber]|uniref:phage protease n=1 Tax=Spartinivicinus ruber TaxID=2683272 RepID=UPI001CA40018|nr:phage protease [Spartinivicinus ruber]
MQLIPAGVDVVGRDGRAWLNDNPQAIVRAFNSSGVELPIDIEHATEHKAPKGEPAPAVAWVKQLETRDGGSIWGLVAWNREGDALVTSKQYRYLSPVFYFEKDTRRISRLTSVGLTNKPNLELKALNQRQTQEESPMDEALLAALGLAPGATVEQAINAINQLKANEQKAVNQQQTPDLNKFVPRSDYDKAINRAQSAELEIKKQQEKALNAEIETLIDKALKDGVITPASVEYHKSCCRQEKGLELFKQFIQQAPKVVKEVDNFDKPPQGSSDQLSAEDKAACQFLGLTEEEFKSNK